MTLENQPMITKATDREWMEYYRAEVHNQSTKISELKDALGRCIGALERLEPTHYNVDDDCWFSCPKAESYCNDQYDKLPKEERPCLCSYKKLHPIWEEAITTAKKLMEGK